MAGAVFRLSGWNSTGDLMLQIQNFILILILRSNIPTCTSTTSITITIMSMIMWPTSGIPIVMNISTTCDPTTTRTSEMSITMIRSSIMRKHN